MATEHFHVAEWRIVQWESTYHPLNVRQEIEKADHWLEANPKRRKKNIYRFLVNWLNKAHAQVLVAEVKAREGYRNAVVGSYREPSKEHVAECEQNIKSITAKYPDLGQP